MADSTLVPDFDSMSLSFQELSEQTKRLGNLPTIDSGAQILQALQAMQQQTTQQFQQINRRLDTMQRQMDTMQHQVDQIASSMDGMRRENTARDANHLAAIENGLLSRGDDRLQPLHSMETGEVIADFPAVVADVDRLADAETKRILRELRLSRDGGVRERRRRILLATGATGIRYLNA